MAVTGVGTEGRLRSVIKRWRAGGKPKKPTREGAGAVLRWEKTKIKENKRKPREKGKGNKQEERVGGWEP